MANARWNGVRFPKAYVNVKLIKTDSRRELDPSFNEKKNKAEATRSERRRKFERKSSSLGINKKKKENGKTLSHYPKDRDFSSENFHQESI